MHVIAVVESKPDISTSAILEHFRERPEWNSLNKLAMASLSESAETGIDSPLSILQHAIKKLNEESRRLELRGDNSELNKPPSAMSDAEKDALRQKIKDLTKP